jgi:hypothetical protein
MENVVIISSKELDLDDLLVGYSDMGTRRYRMNSDRLVVHGSWGYFALSIDRFIVDEYEPPELEALRARIEHPNFYSLEFRTMEAVAQAVLGLPRDHGILIDNDHGMVFTLGEVIERIKKGQDWVRVQG